MKAVGKVEGYVFIEIISSANSKLVSKHRVILFKAKVDVFKLAIQHAQAHTNIWCEWRFGLEIIINVSHITHNPGIRTRSRHTKTECTKFVYIGCFVTKLKLNSDGVEVITGVAVVFVLVQIVENTGADSHIPGNCTVPK